MSTIECTICGKEVKKLVKTQVEGTILEVCEGCVNYGEKVIEIGAKKSVQPNGLTDILIPMKEDETILVENYGKKIVEAREEKNLGREEFAKKIKEKESIIKRIENEEMRPDDGLIKKIENFLGIKLKEPYEKKKLQSKPAKGELTIGDVVELK